MTTLFQQRHYEAIAEVLGKAKALTSCYYSGASDGVTLAAERLVSLFMVDNPRFDAGRFYRAFNDVMEQELNRLDRESADRSPDMARADST